MAEKILVRAAVQRIQQVQGGSPDCGASLKRGGAGRQKSAIIHTHAKPHTANLRLCNVRN